MTIKISKVNNFFYLLTLIKLLVKPWYTTCNETNVPDNHVSKIIKSDRYFVFMYQLSVVLTVISKLNHLHTDLQSN